MIENSSEARSGFFDRRVIIPFFAIIGIGLLVRLYYFPYDIPITLDGFRYFLYAMDTAVLGHLPTSYTFPNNGWPLFMASLFSVFRFENYLDYVTLQRTLTVIFSVSTAIPTYFLCRKFFSQSISVVGAALFVVAPRIVQNSLSGITDPLFILLTTTSMALFLSEGKNKTYISFFVLALSALVRYEGLLLIIPFLILFGIRLRKDTKLILRSLMVLAIFVATLAPVAYLRIEVTGQDGLLSHVLGGANVAVTQGSVLEDAHTKFSLQNGIYNLARYLGAAALPILFIFIPYGLYGFLKNRNYNVGALIFIGIFMLIPALYAYGRDFQDARYVLVVLPIASVIALFSVEKIIAKLKRKNLVIVLILFAIIGSSIAYLDFKKIDYEHEREAVKLAIFIHGLDGAINEFYPESTYVETTALYGLKLPVLSESAEFGPKMIPLSGKSIEDALQNGREYGLSYLVVDNLNRSNNPSGLDDVFFNEEKYPFLTKVFDSKEQGFEYQVKIFKINYDMFSPFTQSG
jgi:hypothetical protein